MTSTLELVRPAVRRSIVRPFAMVWRSWRGLTLRHFGYALLIGIGVGIALGAGSALHIFGIGTPNFHKSLGWWRNLLSEVFDFAFIAPILLLCLAVAANITTSRLPKWLPYVVAALSAVVLDWLLGVVKWYGFMGPLLRLLGDEPAAWPGLTMSLLHGMWLHVPRTAELCLLTALGFMYFREARKRTEALHKVQLERVRVARQTYESRLQTMQARVEPQFLFDTLGEVERLYETQPRVAEQMLDDLIVYLRAALPSLREPSSTLAIELSLVRAWLDIMKIRLHRQLSYAITMPENPQRVRMPPMVLLPLIDHAIQAARSMPLSGRSIRVDAALDDGRLRITFSDAGNAFAPDSANHVGTQVRERLVALYSAEASLVFRNTRTGETQAVVEVPHENAESDHR